MIFTVITAENKLLLEAARKKGIEFERIDDNSLLLPITSVEKSNYDGILQRSLSFTRTLYTTRYFEEAGAIVVNSFEATRLCGDKFLCSLALAKAGVPTPKTIVAFSQEEAIKAIEKLGYPVVIKPVMGSWARLVHKLNDREAAEAAIESREELGGPWHKIYYLQEYVNRPNRDIRAFVVGDEVICAIYRVATEKSGWVTNTGRGGRAENCPIYDELRETCLEAARVVGDGIYGIDLMESENGLVVHEINHTTEFRNSYITGVDIAGKIIDYFIERVKR
jgi:[lysine-biosynthesis-protein LysW]--L-2-aminoadipate ligase